MVKIDLFSRNDDLLYQQLDESLPLLKGELGEVGYEQLAKLPDVLGQPLPLDRPFLLLLQLPDLLSQRGDLLFEMGPALGQFGQGDGLLLVSVDEQLNLPLVTPLAASKLLDQAFELLGTRKHPAGPAPRGHVL